MDYLALSLCTKTPLCLYTKTPLFVYTLISALSKGGQWDAALRLLREAEELFDREVCRHCH